MVKDFKKINGFILLFILVLLATVTVSSAEEVTIFGQQQFTRTSGSPDVFTGNFSGLYTESVPTGKIVVLNGNQVGDHRVEDSISSAEVYLNGELIFSPADFNKNVYFLEADISLSEINSFRIELRSSPGSYIRVSIIQDIPVPSIDFSAVPDVISANESAQLSWSSSEWGRCEWGRC